MKITLNTIYKPKIFFKNRVFFCQIGKNGTAVKFKKKEGDKKTPLGKWRLENIFLRKDKKLNVKIKKSIKKKIIYITPDLVWCDDPKSLFYNVLKKNINKTFNFSYENLYRKDDVYDIIVEINYNKFPIIKNKGSAIFIHCSFNDFRSTLGCVALKKNFLKFLINNLQTKNYIYIK